jgi:16S rRNA (guanine966-N2)-methyltransferase
VRTPRYREFLSLIFSAQAFLRGLCVLCGLRFCFAMRVIAGKFRSRPLRSLRGLDIRPTSDRLREALFDVLTAGNPEALSGSVWLDLFAGTGAVGIEALSRGATMVYFVESSHRAAGVIRDNLASLQIASRFEPLQMHCSAAIVELERRGIVPDFIFIDPPYRMHEIYRETVRQLAASKLSSRALVVVEHEKQFDPGTEFGALRRIRMLKQGDAALSFYKSV